MRSKDLSDAWGFFDGIQAGVGWMTGHWYDLMNEAGASATSARGPANAAAIMGTVNETLMIGLRSIASQRLTVDMIKDFKKTLPVPNKLDSDSDAAAVFKATSIWLETKRQAAENMLIDPVTAGLGKAEVEKINRELIFFTGYEKVYRTGYENLTGKSPRLSPLENAPMTIFTVNHPDYNLQTVPGYDPNEHKAAQDRGEDYRAELEKRRGAN
jgi:hypothetical protein